MMRRFSSVCLAIILLTISFYTIGAETAVPEPDSLYGRIQSGEAKDMHGNIVDINTLLGKPTLVNVWATWCGPCVGEVPALAEAAREYEGRLNIVGIQLDAVFDDMSPDSGAVEAAQNLFGQSGADYINIVPTAEIMEFINQMEVNAIPTTWFLDGEGNLGTTDVGSNDIAGWRARIDEILGMWGN